MKLTKKTKVKNLNIGVVIYTYDKIIDAKINMAIIRHVWQQNKFFTNTKIIHAYDGKKNWYDKKYLEDALVTIPNPGHFEGAANLMDIGFKQFKNLYPKTDYLIFLAADTWLIKPEYVKNILQSMSDKKLCLASCAWNIPDRLDIFDVGMATDFFVVDFKWAIKYKVFPLDYKKYYKKFGELFLYIKGGNLSVEKLAFMHYLKAIFDEFNNNNQLRKLALEKVLILKEREPIHTHRDKIGFWQRKMSWPELGLFTDHDLKKKQIIFKHIKNSQAINEIKKLLNEKVKK